MERAYNLALQSEKIEEVPVGAVIVSADNTLLGQGYNQMISKNNPCAHAEMLAIKEACLTVGNYRLSKTTLYVTLEPCIMCAGAIVHARIERLVFATRDLKTGAAGSVYNVLQGFPLNHCVQIDEGPMQTECAELLTRFFRARRRKSGG